MLGIGDDAAVWQPSRSHRSVITTDALVENVHFRRDTMTLRDAGWRAMASNLSDVAAMGARPLLATIALGIPPDAASADVMELYRGMSAIASAHRCAIAGGDITRAPALVVSITVVGEVRPSNLTLRSGGRPGDVLAVSGELGASRAGLFLVRNERAMPAAVLAEAVQAHRAPQPRVAEGLWLGASSHVHAMMDISDGLSTDLVRLSASSKCAAVVEDVPVAPSARAVALELGEDAQTYALAGGEDFELLIAIQSRAFAYLAGRFRKRFGRPLLRIGHLRSGIGTFVRTGSEERPLPPSGWDHLRA